MKLSWGHRAVAVGGVACLVAVGSTVPAQAGKDRVMRGEFSKLLVNGAYPLPDLGGRAQLVRTGSDTTKLSVHLKGLAPGETYGVHLHNAPCNAVKLPENTPNPGGGHYQDVVSTTDEKLKRPPNELWASSDRRDPAAGVTANRAGKATGHGVAPWRARPEAQSVVIHISVEHGGTTAGGAKLACADLR